MPDEETDSAPVTAANQIRTYLDAVRTGPDGKQSAQLSEHGDVGASLPNDKCVRTSL
jgi:hypothetical protein